MFVKNVLFTLVVLVVFFGGLELVLTWSGVRPVILEEDPMVGFAGNIPLFVEATRPDGKVMLHTASRHVRLFNYQEFPRDKSDDSVRIFCMGGSTTHGRPYYDAVSFCGWLRAYLQAADPARIWEVINAGGVSYASYRVARLMNELKDYQPDLFIVYTGQNEFLEERSYRGIMNMPDWVIDLHGALSATRTYALVQRVVELVRPDPSGKARQNNLLSEDVDEILSHTVGPQSYHRDDRLKRQIIAHFRLNLIRMARIARSVDAGILFIQPAINVKDMSPFKSEHRQGLEAQALAEWQSLFERARRLQEAGDLDAALALYRQARTIDDRYADLHYRIGQALFTLQRYDEADAAFRRAVEEDIVPLRILAAMQQVVADVAAREDVPLIDFPVVLRQAYLSQYGHAVFGKEYFRDHVHTDMEGYRLLGLALFDELAGEDIVVPDAAWNQARRKDTEQRVIASLDPATEGGALLNLGKVLEWAGKFDEAYRAFQGALKILGPDPVIYDRLGGSAFSRGDYDDAVRYMREALEHYPQMTELHANLAMALAKQGETDEAMQEYWAELQLDPTSSFAHAGLAGLLEKAGDDDAALEHYNFALQFRPDNEYALLKTAFLLIRHKRYDEALTRAQKAMQVNPKQYRAHNAIGLIMQMRGNTEQAIRHYNEALRLQPGNAAAQEGLRRMKKRRAAALIGDMAG